MWKKICPSFGGAMAPCGPPWIRHWAYTAVSNTRCTSFDIGFWAALKRPNVRRTSITVTHPSTNRAQRCLTSISLRNHHNTTPHSQPNMTYPHVRFCWLVCHRQVRISSATTCSGVTETRLDFMHGCCRVFKIIRRPDLAKSSHLGYLLTLIGL